MKKRFHIPIVSTVIVILWILIFFFVGATVYTSFFAKEPKYTQYETILVKGDTFLDTVSLSMIDLPQNQRGLQILIETLEEPLLSTVRQGNVVWSFLPAEIPVTDVPALTHYVDDHFYGFTNTPDNILIDEGATLPDGPTRIVFATLECADEKCEDQRIAHIFFVSPLIEKIKQLKDTVILTSIL